MNPDVMPYLSSMVALAATLMLSYLLAYQLSEWLSRAGMRWGVVAKVGPRSSHERPTSRLGGVAMAASLAISAGIFFLALWLMPRGMFGIGIHWEFIGWLSLGAAGMFTLGLLDDMLDLPPGLKLAGQVIAALAVPAAGLRFLYLEMPRFAGLDVTTSSELWAVLWVVFFVNAFNFMDGSDGLAARFTTNACIWIAAAILFVAAIDNHMLFLRGEFYLVLMTGAAAHGFWRVNHPPARLFMGDSGSHLLGYLLAVFLLMMEGVAYVVVPPVAPPTRWAGVSVAAIVLLPFAFDVLATLVRRARLRENLLQAHRGHLYQRLMIAGWSHRDVLRVNLRYFRFCGVVALLYAVTPYLLGRLNEQGPVIPNLIAVVMGLKLLLWVLAIGAMTHYWWMVVKTERTSRAANRGSGENAIPDDSATTGAPATEPVAHERSEGAKKSRKPADV